MDEYEYDYDEVCPHCGHSPIRWRNCANYCCDDGEIDMAEYDDPLWYDEGETEPCPECRGTGIEKWCPSCGKDPREARQPNKRVQPTADHAAHDQSSSTAVDSVGGGG